MTRSNCYVPECSRVAQAEAEAAVRRLQEAEAMEAERSKTSQAAAKTGAATW